MVIHSPIHMKPTFLLTSLACLLGLVSCATDNDDLERRMDERNDAYSNFNERRKIRTDARQERTDMWFDRVMH